MGYGSGNHSPQQFSSSTSKGQKQYGNKNMRSAFDANNGKKIYLEGG